MCETAFFTLGTIDRRVKHIKIDLDQTSVLLSEGDMSR